MSGTLHAKPLVELSLKIAATLTELLVPIAAVAQQPCASGIRVEGTITDPTGAAIYNITTGTDNNGDGDFDDRPSYASAPGAGVYSTRFGLLTTNTVNGNAPRNLGTMPGTVHLDMNLSRAFQFNAKSSDHPRTLTFNIRSADLLNHTNVTTVGTIVSSPTLGQSLAA